MTHAYFLLIPLAILEGPLLAIACGVGAGLGYLNPLIAYLILIIGDLIPDLMYYWIGRYGATLQWVRRVATRTRLIRDSFLPLEELWRAHPFVTLTSAKLAYGVSAPFIVSAGLAAVPFWRFVSYSLTISAVFLGTLAALGYLLALLYGYVEVTLGNAPYYIGGTAFVLFVGLVAATQYARRRLSLRTRIKDSNLIDDHEMPTESPSS